MLLYNNNTRYTPSLDTFPFKIFSPYVPNKLNVKFISKNTLQNNLKENLTLIYEQNEFLTMTLPNFEEMKTSKELSNTCNHIVCLFQSLWYYLDNGIKIQDTRLFENDKILTKWSKDANFVDIPVTFTLFLTLLEQYLPPKRKLFIPEISLADSKFLIRNMQQANFNALKYFSITPIMLNNSLSAMLNVFTDPNQQHSIRKLNENINKHTFCYLLKAISYRQDRYVDTYCLFYFNYLVKRFDKVFLQLFKQFQDNFFPDSFLKSELLKNKLQELSKSKNNSQSVEHAQETLDTILSLDYKKMLSILSKLPRIQK